MIELRHMDVVGLYLIGLILFCYLSRLGAIICDINTIGFVSVYACRVCAAFCAALVASCANGRPTYVQVM